MKKKTFIDTNLAQNNFEEKNYIINGKLDIVWNDYTPSNIPYSQWIFDSFKVFLKMWKENGFYLLNNSEFYDFNSFDRKVEFYFSDEQNKYIEEIFSDSETFNNDTTFVLKRMNNVTNSNGDLKLGYIYQFPVSVKPKNNFKWPDGSSEPIVLNIEVGYFLPKDFY